MYKISDIFTVPNLKKPRQLRQTWLKDVGYHEAPKYTEHLGMASLADFLTVAGPRLDFVKILPAQIANSPIEWLKKKFALYRQFEVEPYLDHTYFLSAYAHGTVDQAIVLGRELGIHFIEFMNTDLAPEKAKNWRKISQDNGVKFIFEFHPPHHWNPNSPVTASNAEEILSAASPFLDDGAVKVMLDHDEFDLMGSRAEKEMQKVIDEIKLETLVFEVDSPKDHATKWRDHLESYLSLFGPNCNMANFMPSQVMHIESQRQLHTPF